MFKKILPFLLISAMLAGILASCSNTQNNPTFNVPVHVEGSIFGGKSDDSIALNAVFNADWLTKEDNGKYSKDLAAFSALLSADSYFREKDLAKGTQNRVLPDDVTGDKYTFTTLLEKMGFTETKHVESYKEKEYEYDTNDSVTMNLGHCTTKDGFDVFVVVIRGCFSAGEWVSAFDVGSDNPVYEEMSGIHPEWTDHSLHKGMGIAANRAIEIIDGFVAEHDDQGKPNCILITGHSRGGGIAEIVGANYEDKTEFKSFTYAFNSTGVTNDKHANHYATIFNIFDSGDLYSQMLPFFNEKLYRYGIEISENISGNNKMRESVASLTGRTDYRSVSNENINDYALRFWQCFENRNSLCYIQTDTGIFVDEEYAKVCHNGIASAAESLGLGEMFTISEVTLNDEGKYDLSIEYYKYALLISLSKILAYGQSAADTVRSVFISNIGICNLTDFILDNSEDIAGGHLIVNSYILAQEYGSDK